MNTHTLIRIVAGAAVFGGAGAALAADLSMIQPNAATVALDRGQALVRFVVSGSAASGDRCGYFVEYGDGNAGDSRVLKDESGPFSRPHERIFRNPGTYTVRASGRNAKTTGPCNGAASTTVTVVAAAAAERVTRAAPAPRCPEGWLLNESSVNWRTGAFSCTAKPAEQLVCADGLRYYERDGMIGCRADRRYQEGRNR